MPATRSGRFVLILALAVLSGCSRWSCYELTFSETPPNGKWFVPVDVSAADEGRHPAFAWMARELASGKTTGKRRGRWLVDDLWALARERNVDPTAVRRPLFFLRGRSVLVVPLNHCLVF